MNQSFFGSWRSFWTLGLPGALGTFLESHGLGFLFGNLSLWGIRLLCSFFWILAFWRSFWTLDLFGALGTFLEALGLGILLGNLSFRGRRLLCSLSLDIGLLGGHFWHFLRGSRPRHSFLGPDLSLRASL